jgi:hypothetical protein
VQWCGSITKTFGHKASAPIKTFIDQAIHHPLVYFPAFFGIKAVVSGQPLSAAAHKYQTEIWDSLKALWMVWVPAQVRCGALRRRRRLRPVQAGLALLVCQLGRALCSSMPHKPWFVLPAHAARNGHVWQCQCADNTPTPAPHARCSSSTLHLSRATCVSPTWQQSPLGGLSS